MVEWKLFWSGSAATVCAAIATLTVVGIVPVWLAVVLAVVAAAGSVPVAFGVLEAAVMFGQCAGWQRRRILIGMLGASFAFAAWTIAAVLVPVEAVYLLVSGVILGLLAVGTYWVARGLEWRLTHVEAPTAIRNPDPDPEDHRERVMQTALKSAGYGWIRIEHGSAEELRDDSGWRFGARLLSRAAARKTAVHKGKDKTETAAKTSVTPETAEALAIALAELTGRHIESDWVRIRKEKGAGRYSITVASRDVMAEVIEYKDDLTPTSITTPALVGVEIDGTQRFGRLDQHTRNVGGSTAGKSALLHLELSHLTRCSDTIVWIGGTEKLYDLVAGWVEPYYNLNEATPIDWIANGATDTLEMMAAAMRLARWRQSRPMHLRKWRSLVLILDEFSFMAKTTTAQVQYGGRWMTAADLASALLCGAASGGIHVHFASQRGTIDHYGGGDVAANLAVDSAFRSKDFAELGRLSGDYHLPSPRHPGEYWRLSADDLPVNLKVPYIQSVDPTKPRLHQGVTVADVALARKPFILNGLTEAEGLEAAGDAYAARHRVVDDVMMAYLTGSSVAVEEPSALSGAAAEVAEATRAELAAIAAAAGLDLAANDPKPRPAPPAPRKREDVIEDILADGLDAAAIAERLAEAGDPAETTVTAATLSRMYKKQRISRPSTGRYAALNPTNERTNA
ncbi:hypothetical protein [Stackebrandtia soli]|uniref:hypothetical protein n=1 Tax=Stackebrandtia soli TaxID=1892856 RepID=UPI0039E8FFCD